MATLSLCRQLLESDTRKDLLEKLMDNFGLEPKYLSEPNLIFQVVPEPVITN